MVSGKRIDAASRVLLLLFLLILFLILIFILLLLFCELPLNVAGCESKIKMRIMIRKRIKLRAG